MCRQAINRGLFCLLDTTMIALEITNVIWTNVLKCGCLHEDHEVASSDLAKSEKLQEGRHRDHFPFVFISNWRGRMSTDDRFKMKSLLSHDTCFSFTHSDVDLNVVEFRIHTPR